MTRVFITLCIVASGFFCTAQNIYDYSKEIRQLIEAAKDKDKVAIAGQIRYPFSRFYPIPDIQSPEEFILRFEQVFDDSLLLLIATSDIDKDWSTVGWRGAALNTGVVWVDEYGLSHINYRTVNELEKEQDLIRLVRNALHPSLKKFIEPCWVIKTEKFRIRIDRVTEDTYRYASWGVNDSIGAKPDLVIYNGKFEYCGSGGDYQYVFTNGEYKYICYRNYLRASEDPDAELRIYIADECILYQDAEIKEYLDF